MGQIKIKTHFVLAVAHKLKFSSLQLSEGLGILCCETLGHRMGNEEGTQVLCAAAVKFLEKLSPLVTLRGGRMRLLEEVS